MDSQKTHHIHDINSALFALQAALPLLQEGMENWGDETDKKILLLSLEKLDKLVDSWQSFKMGK